jgi:NitT/TauT family transport system permease protein
MGYGGLFVKASAKRVGATRPVLLRIRSRLTYGQDLCLGIAGIAATVLIWCWLTYGGHISPYFLPTPTRLYEGLVEFQQKGWLVPAIVGSFWRVTKSLVLVTLIGVPIGLSMGAFAPIDAFLRRLVNAAKSVPTTGIAGLIVLWFGIEERAKVVYLFLGAIFYMIILVRAAVLSVNEEFVKVAIDMGAGRLQTIVKVLIPAAMPLIWEAIAVSNGIMWTYIVLAEYINGNENQLGLGYLLNIGSRTEESGKVFGILLLVAVVSSFTDYVLQTVRTRYFNW